MNGRMAGWLRGDMYVAYNNMRARVLGLSNQPMGCPHNIHDAFIDTNDSTLARTVASSKLVEPREVTAYGHECVHEWRIDVCSFGWKECHQSRR